MADEVASVFAASQRSAAEFPDYRSPNLRKAISLGRFAQEPLAEMAYLWHQAPGSVAQGQRRGEEALYLRLHPLLDLVHKAHVLG